MTRLALLSSLRQGGNLPTKARGGQVDSTFHQISVCPVTLWWRMLPQLQSFLYLRRWSEVLVWKGSRCLAAVWTIWSLNRLPLYKRLDLRLWQYRNFHDLGMSWNVMRSLKRLKAVLFIVRTSCARQGECERQQGQSSEVEVLSLVTFHWWPKEAFSKLLASVSEATEGPRRRGEWYRYNRLMTKNEDAFKSVRLFNSQHMSLDWIWKQGFTCNALWPKDFLDAARTSAVCPPSCLAKGWVGPVILKLAKMSCPLSCH